MSADHEAALEEAISDIQLLGSPRQVEIATAFARAFAQDQQADTEPLLEDLRASLRRELQLEVVHPRRVWLRISRDPSSAAGPLAGERFLAIWHERATEVASGLRLADGVIVDGTEREATPSRSPFVVDMLRLAEHSPLDVVVACERRVSNQLRELLEHAEAGDVSRLGVTEMAFLAYQRRLITEATRNGVEGLHVLQTMAFLDGGSARLTEHQAREYVGLTEGVLFAMRMPPTAGATG